MIVAAKRQKVEAKPIHPNALLSILTTPMWKDAKLSRIFPDLLYLPSVADEIFSYLTHEDLLHFDLAWRFSWKPAYAAKLVILHELRFAFYLNGPAQSGMALEASYPRMINDYAMMERMRARFLRDMDHRNGAAFFMFFKSDLFRYDLHPQWQKIFSYLHHPCNTDTQYGTPIRTAYSRRSRPGRFFTVANGVYDHILRTLPGDFAVLCDSYDQISKNFELRMQNLFAEEDIDTTDDDWNGMETNEPLDPVDPPFTLIEDESAEY